MTLENVMSGFEKDQWEDYKLDTRFENLISKAEEEEITTWEFRDEGKKVIDQIFEDKLFSMISPENVDNYQEIANKLIQEKLAIKRLFEQALIEQHDNLQIYDNEKLWSEYFRNVIVERIRERIRWERDEWYEEEPLFN